MTIGTFTRKIEPHQKYFSSRPPVIGPSAIAMPEAPAQMPIAFARSFGANTFWMIDSVCGCTSAAPMPISARYRISSVGLCAYEHSSEVDPNASMPSSSTVLRPRRSPKTPAGISSPANTSAYESTAHCIWLWLAPRSCWIVFSATLRIVLSRITTSRQTTITPKMAQRRFWIVASSMPCPSVNIATQPYRIKTLGQELPLRNRLVNTSVDGL